ncbi:hypothetical protein EDB19DRAFT_1833348 [Suillus lakei]|nr:hypothetical protein EDB19DRAFT_1833348 [Suillus lakei]
MARSGHSTHLTSGKHRACQPQTQKLTENEILELKNYLPERTSAKKMEKQAVFTAIARASWLFAPKVNQAQWKKRKQMYKTWLFNNKKKKERKDMIKHRRRWTPRMVIYQQKWEEVLKRIEDESGVKPGGPEEMWRQCGMRVFVMSAWKNEQGEVLFGMHNDNKALGDGDSFMKTKDWEDIKPVWQEYAQEQFSARAQDGGRQVKGGHKRIRKPAFKLATDGDGMPLLPDITKMKLEEKKAIAVVSWSTIIQSQGDFVARKYVLVDVDLKEPSKLQNWDTTALLNVWYAQQETGEGPTFLFKAWKNKDGDMVALVLSRNLLSHQTRKVRTQIIRRPQYSSTEAKSDPESDTHHMEDDADDDAVGNHLAAALQ